MPLRLVFMGTPDFAVPTLLELVGGGHEIAAVYTRALPPVALELGDMVDEEQAVVVELSVLQASREYPVSQLHPDRDLTCSGRATSS